MHLIVALLQVSANSSCVKLLHAPWEHLPMVGQAHSTVMMAIRKPDASRESVFESIRAASLYYGGDSVAVAVWDALDTRSPDDDGDMVQWLLAAGDSAAMARAATVILGDTRSRVELRDRAAQYLHSLPPTSDVALAHVRAGCNVAVFARALSLVHDPFWGLPYEYWSLLSLVRLWLRAHRTEVESILGCATGGPCVTNDILSVRVPSWSH